MSTELSGEEVNNLLYSNDVVYENGHSCSKEGTEEFRRRLRKSSRFAAHHCLISFVELLASVWRQIWNFLIYWSAITNFKILRELDRGENDVKHSLV